MAECFDLDGNELGSEYAACSQKGAGSQCCSKKDGCAENGLCVTNDTASNPVPYFIDGCTDKNWTPDICLKNCQANFVGNGVQPCGGDQFCCYGFGGCDCTNSSQTFSLPALGFVVPPGGSIVTGSTANPSSSTTKSTLSPGATTPPASTVGSQSSSATPQASERSNADSSNVGSNNNNNIGIGLGVGLGVGIPLIIAVLGLLWFVMRRQQRGEGYREYYPEQKRAYHDPNHESTISPAQELPTPVSELAHFAPTLPPQELETTSGIDQPEFLR